MDTQKIIRNIAKKTNNNVKPCCICGNMKLAVNNDYALVPKDVDLRQGYRFVFTMCEKCGHIEMFHSDTLLSDN